MSKFTEKLKQLRRAEPQPMGFAVNKIAAENPKLQMVIRFNAGSVENVSGFLDSADAAIIEIRKAGDIDRMNEVCGIRDGLPGGGWIGEAEEEVIQKVMDSSCDFLVFSPLAPLSVTKNDKVGRILELDASLNEGLLRTANDLPVDAILVDGPGEENVLNINRLMIIQRLLYLVGKPVLVAVPVGISDSSLQSLWDMGITGVVVDAAGGESGEKLSSLRAEIDKLAPPAYRKKARVSPVLPGIQPQAPKPSEEGGEEEEEE